MRTTDPPKTRKTMETSVRISRSTHHDAAAPLRYSRGLLMQSRATEGAIGSRRNNDVGETGSCTPPRRRFYSAVSRYRQEVILRG